MPTLPPSGDWTGAAITEGQFKAAQTALRDYLAGLFGADGVPATALAALGASLSAVTSKSAAYAPTITDRGKLIRCTNGPWTLALPAASTVGAGFTLGVSNEGAGAITIDGDLGETINGKTTLVVDQDVALLLVCNGSDWLSIGSQSSSHGIQRFTSSGVFTVPTGVTQVWVTLCGGGGQGGRGNNNNGRAGGGGGGGGHSEICVPVTVTPGASISVTVGAGGSGAALSGNAGGATSFGAYVSAAGGGGGLYASGANSPGAGGAAGGAGGEPGMKGWTDNDFDSVRNEQVGKGGRSFGRYGRGGDGSLVSTSYSGQAGMAGVCIVEW